MPIELSINRFYINSYLNHLRYITKVQQKALVAFLANCSYLFAIDLYIEHLITNDSKVIYCTIVIRILVWIDQFSIKDEKVIKGVR